MCVYIYKIIKHTDGYESKNLFINCSEKTKLNLIFFCYEFDRFNDG